MKMMHFYVEMAQECTPIGLEYNDTKRGESLNGFKNYVEYRKYKESLKKPTENENI